MTANANLNTHNVLGVKVHSFSWQEAFETALTQLEKSDDQHIYAFLNANNANIASSNPEYMKCLEDFMVLPDGVGVDIASKLVDGESFTANLNGTDFIPGLLVYLERPLIVALVGSTWDTTRRAADLFTEATPWHRFVAVSDGYFDPDQSDDVLDRLEALSADIVLVGMGSPRQEMWVHKYIKPHHGKLIFTVGALFDFVSESVPRAPLLWRKWRLEWLFRLLVEPGRLWRRYILGNPLFIWRVVRTNLISRLHRSDHSQ